MSWQVLDGSMAAMRLDSIICKDIVYQVGNIQAGNVQCRQIDKNRTVFESESSLPEKEG